MRVEPEYAAVGKFFETHPVYEVPKYQRAYAWDKDEIEDFVTDLKNVFNARKSNTPKNHFLGSIVSVEYKMTGVVNKHRHELVDGQQRVATFVLLAASVIEQYNKIITICTSTGDSHNQGIAEDRRKELSERFIEFSKEVNRVREIQSVLKLSKADNDFFAALIRYRSLIPTRDSHRRLKSAYDSIEKQVKLLTEDIDVNIYIDNLEILQHNIDGDFSLLRIVTYDRLEAYTFFQVLNDRGKSLTEGDLLRARTLELLESHTAQQDAVENYWDNILSDQVRQTDNFLRWIYASYKGIRPSTTTLFDDFLKAFYPQNTLPSIVSAHADTIFLTTQLVKTEIENCRKLEKGEWLFPFGQPITAWDRSRLSLLMNELGNTNAMPLLLAASKLDHRKFAEIVSLVERFMFRYTLICNQHHSPIMDIYHAESTEIRRNPSGYDVLNLKKKLQALLDKRADDSFFKTSLNALIYAGNGNGRSNKPLKYFLITLEDYWRWYHEDNAVGEPVCKDKSKLFYFADTTIEHVYPQNAPPRLLDVSMEDLKNTIGNLTIMGQTDNTTIGNDDFTAKRTILRSCSAFMTQKIATNTVWDRTTVVTRTDELKEMATKIFKML